MQGARTGTRPSAGHDTLLEICQGQTGEASRCPPHRGLLRVTRRDSGIRCYAVREQTGAVPADAAARRRQLDALIDVAVRKYTPLPLTSLNRLVRRLRYSAPQLRGGLESALARVKRRLRRARVDGIDWYWPGGEDPKADRGAMDERVRLLAPFDPVVWDRTRFEMFWSWRYRFEAYTPPAKRKLGHYALPLLWRDEVVGWANVSVKGALLVSEMGYVAGRAPRDRAFGRELERELALMRAFLRL